MTEQKKRLPIFKLEKFTLFTKVEGSKMASLDFSELNCNPSMTVFTRTPSDKDGKGIINASFFSMTMFLSFLSELERMARNKEPNKSKMVLKRFPRDANGKINGNLEPHVELFYGKNDKGVCWLSIQQSNRPKLVFDLVMDRLMEIVRGDGTTIDAAEGSMIFTLALCANLRHAFMTRCLPFRDIYQTSMKGENTNSAGGIENLEFDDTIPY